MTLYTSIKLAWLRRGFREQALHWFHSILSSVDLFGRMRRELTTPHWERALQGFLRISLSHDERYWSLDVEEWSKYLWSSLSVEFERCAFRGHFSFQAGFLLPLLNLRQVRSREIGDIVECFNVLISIILTSFKCCVSRGGWWWTRWDDRRQKIEEESVRVDWLEETLCVSQCLCLMSETV